jgi:hypothetical protein
MKQLSIPLLGSIFVVCLGAAEPDSADKAAEAIHERLAPFFRPPEELTKDFGGHKSPLNFYDNMPVNWLKSRQEILKTWHKHFPLDVWRVGHYCLLRKVILEAKATMELRDALDQIAEIRQQVARSEVFRGYRALPVALSGLLAFATAGLQTVWLVEVKQSPFVYFTSWIGVAFLSVGSTGWEMAWRLRRSSSVLERERSIQAVGQFLPCLIAGALLLLVLMRFAPESLWMLPGLWAMFFGLGICASWRLLPPAILWIGIYYLAAGLVCLAVAQGEAALSPWAMGIPFGAGQLLTASVLYWNLERTDEQE